MSNSLIEFTPNLISSLKGSSTIETFTLLDGTLSLATDQLSKARKLQAASLWMISEIWSTLSYDITLQWDDFQSYARERTGYDDSTITNYIRVARVWYNPDLALDRVTLCDSEGNEVIDGASGGLLSIKPDPFTVPISKLILTATAYEEGRLTETDMGMLFNSDVTWNDVRERLRDNRLISAPITRFFLEGTQLVVTENGVSKGFGELYLFDDDPLVRKGVQHVLIGAGIIRP